MDTAYDKDLLNQDQALTHYIGELLSREVESVPAVNEVASTPARKALSADEWSMLARSLKKMEVTNAVPASVASGVATATAPVVQPHLQSISVLMCRVGGLKLGIPIEDVVKITANDRKYQRSRDSAYFEVQGTMRRIIDLKEIVLPAQYRSNDFEISNRLVVLSKQPWVISCDEVGEIERIAKNQIRWRSERTSRPWLLGTAMDKGMVLIDVAGLDSDE